MEAGFGLDISEHLKEILIILMVVFLAIAIVKTLNYDDNKEDDKNRPNLNEIKEVSTKNKKRTKKILRDKFGNKYILVQGNNYVKDIHENIFNIYKDGYGNIYLCSNDENGNQYSEKDRLF